MSDNNEAEILFPEREYMIGQEKVTVHEFTFQEGLRLGAIAQPLITALSDVFSPECDDDTGPDFTDISVVFADHWEVLFEMMSVATGRSREWLDNLSDADGQTLMMGMWLVNRDFFTRRVVSKSLDRHLQNQAGHPASVRSTQH